MKNLQKYWKASLFVKLLIVAALAFLSLEVNLLRTQTSAAAPLVSSKISSVIPDEGSATLSPANMNIWTHFYEWHSSAPYCGPAFVIGVAPEDIAGSIVSGFKHRYDKGAVVLGCPDGSNTVYRGTVWFDLSDVVSKAPPLHVFVKSATLHFKNLSGECPGELLLGTADWLKGYADNTLVPGDPIATLGSCGSGGCSVDVQTVVNNWVRGAEHGGYANNGFVFKGMREGDLKYGDNDSCLARYGDFSLSVTYKYDQEPVILLAPPKRVDMAVGRPGVASPVVEGLNLARTNVALAANGGVASASSFTPDTEFPGSEFQPRSANDGNISGSTNPHNGFWRDGTDNVWPDWLQIDFAGSRKISEIDVFTVQDSIDTTGPTDKVEGLSFTLHGIVDFEVQYWDGSAWQTIPGGAVKGNNKVLNRFALTPGITTSKIRVYVSAALNKRSRIVELEAWR